jgi:tetratricopeptide (TPR) repeat protein
MRRGGIGPGVRVLRIAGMLVFTVAIAVGGFGARAHPDDSYAEMVGEDADYAAGIEAIKHKQWDVATQRLSRSLVRHPDNPDLHNYLGFSYRHLKQFDKAFEHYKRAIALDPRHRGAHEYIGEAYLMVGDLKGAEKHVAALREICLLPCEELTELEGAVARYRTTAKQ